MSLLATLKQQAGRLRQSTLVVYFVARDPQTPVVAKALALLVAAYALSPIDLIPDFIPVLGYLDDLVLLPLGIALVIRLTPPAVIESARAAAARTVEKPVSYGAAAFIVCLWLALVLVIVRYLLLHVR